MLSKIKQKNFFWLEFISILIFGVVVSFSIIWPVKSLPSHLDFASNLIEGAGLLQSKNFTPYTLAEISSVVPPIYHTYLTTLWSLASKSLEVSHFSIFPFVVIFFTANYYLLNRYTSKLVSLTGSFLILITPFIIKEIQLVSLVFASTSVSTMAIALWVYDKKIFSLGLYAVSLLIHWFTILLLPFFLVAHIFEHKKDYQKYRPLFIPIAVWFIWMFYHASNSGWWFTRSKQLLAVPSLTVFLGYFLFSLKQLFFLQINWLLLLPGFAAAAFFKFKEQRNLSVQIVSTLITSLVFFSLTGTFALSKTLIIFPILFLLSLIYLQKFIEYTFKAKNDWLILLYMAFASVIAISQWNKKPPQLTGYQSTPIENLSYQDDIYLYRLVAGKLQGEYPNAEIYGAYPEVYQLTNPLHGYVTKTLNFQSCNNFEPNADVTQIIYAHIQHPTQTLCDNLLSQVPHTSIDRITYGNRWVELFEVTTATVSAEMIDQNQSL